MPIVVKSIVVNLYVTKDLQVKFHQFHSSSQNDVRETMPSFTSMPATIQKPLGKKEWVDPNRRRWRVNHLAITVRLTAPPIAALRNKFHQPISVITVIEKIARALGSSRLLCASGAGELGLTPDLLLSGIYVQTSHTRVIYALTTSRLLHSSYLQRTSRCLSLLHIHVANRIMSSVPL